ERYFWVAIPETRPAAAGGSHRRATVPPPAWRRGGRDRHAASQLAILDQLVLLVCAGKDLLEAVGDLCVEIEADLAQQDAQPVNAFASDRQRHVVGAVLQPRNHALDFPAADRDRLAGPVGAQELADLFLAAKLLAADLQPGLLAKRLVAGLAAANGLRR